MNERGSASAPGEPVVTIEPGMILAWPYTPDWTVTSRLVVDRIEGFAAYVHHEDSGTVNRLDLSALRSRARLVGRVRPTQDEVDAIVARFDAIRPEPDLYDRLIDWFFDKFVPDWRVYWRSIVRDPVFSYFDFWAALTGALVIVGPRSDLWVLPVVAFWGAVRLWAGRRK